MDNYDEFGNYIGPSLEDSDEELEEEININRRQYDDDNEEEEEHNAMEEVEEEEEETSPTVGLVSDENRIVLHEDKKYFLDAEEIYPDVKTVILDEDAQDIKEPIIKMNKIKSFSDLSLITPEFVYDLDYLKFLFNSIPLIRNVAVIGHLHHGKSLFLNYLIQYIFKDKNFLSSIKNFTDTRKDEQQRELSIKSTPLSIVLKNLKNKSYLINFIDCPGHTNFSDEITASLRQVDGVLLVVDAAEGVMLQTKRALKQAILEELPITLVINKVDRLILELKLPPADAYFKLMYIVDEVNDLISTYSMKSTKKNQRLSPELGNIAFASALHGWSFTLESFAQIYINNYESFGGKFPFSAEELSLRLWGDWYLDVETNRLIKKKNKKDNSIRTFIYYVLEPLYKIYSVGIGENIEDIQRVMLDNFNIKLTKNELKVNPLPLLQLLFFKFLGEPYGVTQMISTHLPSPQEQAPLKVQKNFTGSLDTPLYKSLSSSDASGPLCATVTKLINAPDGSHFYALARILSGKIHTGQKIKVLGENFTQEDDEDMAVVEVGSIYVPVGRFIIEVNMAGPGTLVLIGGIDGSIKKTATLVTNDENILPFEDLSIFTPLKFDQEAVMKLSIEPLNPSELPKMIEGLRKISKSYPSSKTKVEESGEHIVFGTGELYLDSIMHDLRHLYSDIEIKVADPVVSFTETVIESSALNCFAYSANHQNKLTMIAEPLDEGLVTDLAEGNIKLTDNINEVSKFFQTKYNWDLLSSRSIWTFGADSKGADSPTNLLINHTLPSRVNTTLLYSVKENIIQGFKWGISEGPLCEEPIYNTKFRLLDAELSDKVINRSAGQIIPTARRVVLSSFLTAQPRLCEPVCQVEIQTPISCVDAIRTVCMRRRGSILNEVAKPGLPIYIVNAYIPMMDR